MARPALDLVDQRFTKLVAICPDGRIHGYIAWQCRCDCGREVRVPSGSLRSGATRSCGCLRASSHRSHGHTVAGRCTPEYQAWVDMKKRCLNPRRPKYRYWGGKGVTVDPRWVNDYPAFYAYVGPRPSPDYELDRIDPYGNYEPGNVRWFLCGQGRTRRSRLLTYRDETLSLTEWSRRTGIPSNTLYGRLANGWPIERALSGRTPLRSQSIPHRVTEVLAARPRSRRELSTVLGVPSHRMKETLRRKRLLTAALLFG
jgi:hypothetical protein